LLRGSFTAKEGLFFKLAPRPIDQRAANNQKSYSCALALALSGKAEAGRIKSFLVSAQVGGRR
jgi:hypothetical protein